MLWPDRDPSFVAVPEDDAATHFATRLEGRLVAVGSLFPGGGDIRLRKLATLPAFQGRGIGRAMLDHMIAYAIEHGATRFWCDARVASLGFYERAGMTAFGPRFDKSGVSYQRMQILRADYPAS